MLNRMRTALARSRAGSDERAVAARAAEALAFVESPIAAMRAVEAPDAANDDPLAGAHDAVERALRTAGYLR